MAITNGPNIGQMVNGAMGEAHYAQLMKFLRAVDSLVMPHAISTTITAQPASPADGDLYIVPPAATGAQWAGKDNQLARWSSVANTWEFMTAKPGWLVHDDAAGKFVKFGGATWTVFLDEMPQAVAEGGLSETLYAATARRVRQAIAAWWAGITNIDGKIIGATMPAAGKFTSLSANKSDVYGYTSAPSLNALSEALVTLRGIGLTALAFGSETSAEKGYPLWLQTRHSTLDDTNYPLDINPLGGAVRVGPGGISVAGTMTATGALHTQTAKFGGLGYNPYGVAFAPGYNVGWTNATDDAPGAYFTYPGSGNVSLTTGLFANGSLSATGALTTAGIKEDAAGNVGIGVVPSAWYSFYKTVQAGDYAALSSYVPLGGAIVSSNATATGDNAWSYRYSYFASRYQQSAGNHYWLSAPSGTVGDPITFRQDMALVDGNLLVGATSTPGGHRFSRSGYQTIMFDNTYNAPGARVMYSVLGLNADDAGSYHLICETNGANKLFIHGNGNVVNANNSYGSLSDIKLKENVTDAPSYWDRYKRVQWRKYNLKADPSHSQLGVVAQELEAVFPGLIEESDDYTTVTKTREIAVPAVTEERLVTEAVFDKGDQIAPPIFEAVEVTPATTRIEEYEERIPTGEKTKSVKYSVLGHISDVVVQEAMLRIEALETENATLKAQIASVIDRLVALEAA